MYKNLKKIAAYSLVFLVIFFTVLSILAIWEIIDVSNILNKSLGSLLVIFVSSAIILFIFGVILRNDEHQPPKPPFPPQNPSNTQNNF